MKTRSKKIFLGGKRRRHRGGSCLSPATVPDYKSAGTYMLNTVGDGNQQWNDTFSQSVDGNSSNVLRTLSGKMLGGKKRGGNILPGVVEQAAVPLALLGLQQAYSKKKSGGNYGMLAEAATPLSLLALQQSYGKKDMLGSITPRFSSSRRTRRRSKR